MPSGLFVSWVKDMLVLLKLKFSGNVIRRGYAGSGSLVHCWSVHGVQFGIYLTGV